MKSGAARLGMLPANFFASISQRIDQMQEAGEDVIRLDIGSPDLPPEGEILETLNQSATQPDHHRYQPNKGPRALREAWVALYRRQFGVELDPEEEILPLLGSKEGIFHITQAIVDPGDPVLVPDPGYLTYSHSALFAGGDPFFMPLRQEDGFLPDLKAVPRDVAQRATMMWLNYPNNPTGATTTHSFFAQALDFARGDDILLCHDAAYSQVTFDGYRAPSLMEIAGARETAVEFNSLSKAYNMAGWRVGVLVGCPAVLQSVHLLKTNVDSSHFLPIMEAAVVAMTGDQEWIARRNEVYRERRDLVVNALQRLGILVEIPKGSLYIWLPCPAGYSSLDFTRTLLEQAKVSLAPGVIFGERGEGFARISIAAPENRLTEAIQRLSAWWALSAPARAAWNH